MYLYTDDWKRVVKLSHRLREFIGTKYALKSAVQRRFRDYIDKHKLYTKKHNIKRVICDEALRKVFKRKKFDRFMLNEFLDKVS
ncbi:hypothetical protein EON65_29705 [archaeon]|nr:MAG: hypothetical protein EON65_29705 [archaeon]